MTKTIDDETSSAHNEEPWHYKRTCTYCGYIWGGLHCIHDSYQNPCPKCGRRPEPVEGECDCEFDYGNTHVFCKDCKMIIPSHKPVRHKSDNRDNRRSTDYYCLCEAKTVIEYDPVSGRHEFIVPEHICRDKNVNCDCPDYEAKGVNDDE